MVEELRQFERRVLLRVTCDSSTVVCKPATIVGFSRHNFTVTNIRIHIMYVGVQTFACHLPTREPKIYIHIHNPKPDIKKPFTLFG